MSHHPDASSPHTPPNAAPGAEASDGPRSQFALLGTRRFAPYFVTQFLGAFNDNVLKNALTILVAYQLLANQPDRARVLVNVSAALFVLPFFLFSATSGQLADKLDKSRIMRGAKLFEVLLALAASAGFLLGHIPTLVGTLFFMGLQSTVFGPAKYGILPQHLRSAELVGGNAWVELATNLAILLGTLVGGVLIGAEGGRGLVSGVIVAVAAAGYVASRFIPPAPPVAPELRVNWNPFSETWRTLKLTAENFTVFRSVLGISWFWLLGSVYVAQLPSFTKETLGGNEQVVTLQLTLFAVGIGLGSLLCERLSRHTIELGLVPLGAIGLTLFGVDLVAAAPSGPTAAPEALEGVRAFLARPGSWRIVVDLLGIGASGGVFIVPLYALVQKRADPRCVSRVIAGNNILNALFMVAAAAGVVGLLHAGLDVPQVLLVAAILNAVVSLYIFAQVPEFALRFAAWVLVNLVYRLRAGGLEHVPPDGPAVVVCNHVTVVDALVVGGSCPRPIRFLLEPRHLARPVQRYLLQAAGAVPMPPAVEGALDPEALELALERVARLLAEGDLVGLFPEGAPTPDGEVGPFHREVERILARTAVPVVPMALRGLWGSFFSRKEGRAMGGRPRRFWSRIELAVGPAVPPSEASAEGLRQRVLALRGDRA